VIGTDGYWRCDWWTSDHGRGDSRGFLIFFLRVFIASCFRVTAPLETVERTLTNMCEFKRIGQQAASGVHDLGRFHVYFHAGFLVHQGEVVYR